MRKITITLVFLLFAGLNFAFAQTKAIQGTVTSADDGSPLPGVTVLVKGTANGTVTDGNGKYSLQVGRKATTLVFSFVGMKTQEIAINGRSTINVAMKQSATALNQVVITALGIKRQAKALGYSVTEMKGKALTEVPTTNPMNALEGKIAGVNISQGNTGAAGATRVIIRGASSLTGNNQPLYVVDGIPIINSTKGSVVGPFGGLGGDGGDDISGINPDDIASVTVLKGSSAAALYGSLASNGVIMITTKSGKNAKKKLSVEYSGSFLFDKVNTSLINMQTEYGQGLDGLKPGWEYDANGNPIEMTDEVLAKSDAFNSTLYSWGAKMDGSMVYNWDGKKRPYSYTGSNLDRFYNVGKNIVNSVAVSKGGKNFNYRFSFTNLDNHDIFPKTTLNRKTISLNVSAQITPKLSSSNNIMYVVEKTHNRITIGDTPGNANTTAYELPGNLNIYGLKPGYNDQGTELRFEPSQWITNPYWVINKFNNNDKKNRIIASSTLKYEFTKWLNVTGRAGWDAYDYSRKDVVPYGTAFRPAGSLSQRKATYQLFNADIMIGFDKKIKDFAMHYLVGANTKISSYEGLSAAGSNFVVHGLEDLNNTTLPIPSYGYYKTRTNSLYGSFETDYKDYLFLTFTGRNDWFSTLSFPGKTTPNSGFYWSVSGSFLLNNAFKLPESIEYLKIRGSYAQVAGGARQAYALNLDYAILGTFQGQPYGAINGSTIPNPDLVPFQKAEFEFGIDGRLFKNRLFFDLAYYSNKTKDDIVRTSSSTASGFSAAILNIGKLGNKGIEVLIGGTPVKAGKFSWKTSINFAYNDSKIIHTDDKDTPIDVDGSQTRSKTAIIAHIVGEHYGVIYGSSYKRDDQGRIVYDLSSTVPKAVQGPYKVLGQGIAPYTLGFSNTFKYKTISLSFLIDGKFGGSLYSGTNWNLTLAGLTKKTLEGRENGLVVSGVDKSGNPFTQTVAPKDLRTYWGFIGAENGGISEEFVYSSDFIKFRQLSLTYSFPKKLLANTFIGSASISLIGRNLFYLFKKIDNVDPEADLNSLNSQGIERFGLPATRTYGFSLNVKF